MSPMFHVSFSKAAPFALALSLAAFPARAEDVKPLADDVFEARFLLGFDGEYQGNLDLDDSDHEDVQEYEPFLRTSLTYRPTDWLRAFLETEIKVKLTYEQGEPDDVDPSLDVTQAYLQFRDVVVEDSELTIGRFLMRDRQEWLFDENLDGLRFSYEKDEVEIDFSVSRVNLAHRDLFDSDSVGDQINNVALMADFEVAKDLWIGGYGMVRDDRSPDPAEGNPVHFGLGTHGELADNLTHWLDLAAVRGDDGTEPLEGYAVNAGATYTFERLPAAPRLTLGYAWASGDDDPDDGRNTEFRQTGLQSNEGRFGDSAKFKYYGEVFDPELSNMSILTLGLGINPTEQLSVDLVYHRYRQSVATGALRDSAIDLDPNEDGGPFSKDLGEEIDFVVGYRPTKAWEFEFAAGYFQPGAAYRIEQPGGSSGPADPAFFTRLGVEYRF